MIALFIKPFAGISKFKLKPNYATLLVVIINLAVNVVDVFDVR